MQVKNHKTWFIFYNNVCSVICFEINELFSDSLNKINHFCLTFLLEVLVDLLCYFTFIVIISVSTIVLLCRHGLKQPVKSCKQVSDVSSSSFHIPQKTDISYNCQGSRCKQVRRNTNKSSWHDIRYRIKHGFIGFTGFIDQRGVLILITLYCHFLFQSHLSDSLYSLDSDYFLNILEDISTQI